MTGSFFEQRKPVHTQGSVLLTASHIRFGGLNRRPLRLEVSVLPIRHLGSHSLSNAPFTLQMVCPTLTPFRPSCSHYRQTATDWTRFLKQQ